MLASSTVLRAQQTAELISRELPTVPRIADDVLLSEGLPVLPLPQGADFLKTGKFRLSDILEEGPRIEAGFRKYVHRDVDHKSGYNGELYDGYVPKAKDEKPNENIAVVQDHE